MMWNEQPADVQPALITGLLRRVSMLDAVLLVSQARRGPAVYMTSQCREGILAHLRSHRTEVGGLLIGRAYVAGTTVPGSWGPLISIDRFVASEEFRSSPVSLAMGTEIWERARSAMADEDRMVVGWCHSHPNLGAFFSGTDRATQRAFFNRPYSVGLVIDPLRSEESRFIGPASARLKLDSVRELNLAAIPAHDLTISTQEPAQ